MDYEIKMLMKAIKGYPDDLRVMDLRVMDVAENDEGSFFVSLSNGRTFLLSASRIDVDEEFLESEGIDNYYKTLNAHVAGTGYQFERAKTHVRVVNENGVFISYELSIKAAIHRYIPFGCGEFSKFDLYKMAEQDEAAAETINQNGAQK